MDLSGSSWKTPHVQAHGVVTALRLCSVDSTSAPQARLSLVLLTRRDRRKLSALMSLPFSCFVIHLADVANNLGRMLTHVLAQLWRFCHRVTFLRLTEDTYFFKPPKKGRHNTSIFTRDRHPSITCARSTFCSFGKSGADRNLDVFESSRYGFERKTVSSSGRRCGTELPEQSSSIGRGRFFPTPFGRTSNHHSSDSDSPNTLEGKKELYVRTRQPLHLGIFGHTRLPLLLPFFSALFFSALLFVLFGGVTSRAPFCCACLAEVLADREMWRLICFPYLKLFFVKLKTFIPGNTPLWRLLVSSPCQQLIFNLQASMPGYAPLCDICRCYYEPTTVS